MQMTPATDDAVVELTEHVTTGDTAVAHQLVDRLLSTGWSPERVVTDLLGAVQERIGRSWQLGTCTVADEHAATAVVDDLLGTLGRLVPSPRSTATVALVCAEGEWHVTPARMAALLLRQAGWRITFLGGSTPLDHLERSLAAARPSFVAISCTDPRFLLGAGRVAGLARRLGVPSLAGGAGFGARENRAMALGITGWAPDASQAVAILHRWLDDPPSVSSTRPPPPAPLPLRQRQRRGVTEQAIQRLATMAPTILPHGGQRLEDVRRDLGELLHLAHVAAVCDDPELFTGFVRWLSELQPPRGLPHEALEPSVQILWELTHRFDDGSADVLAAVAG
jgi:MerR family transcriptional regulator, light-induced transcriptional regulator